MYRRDSRRRFLKAAVSAMIGCTVTWADEPAGPASDELPRTGKEHSECAPLDRLMSSFLIAQQAPGAALAVARHGRLVYARGFGYADIERKLPVEPQSIFRIASVSKPLTAVAVLQLVDRGRLRLDDRMVDRIGIDPFLPHGGTVDSRLGEVTVRHLLQHTAGWDRDRSFDPIARPRRIAEAMGKSLPIGPKDVVRYAMGCPFDSDPGERYAYSNVGYLMLAEIIEAIAGRPYEEHVRQEVLRPLGITSARLGNGAVEERAAGEVKYYDRLKRRGPAVVGPRNGQTVPLPDGAENFDAFGGHGGWISSAVDLVRFATAFDAPSHCPILNEDAIRTMFAPPEGPPGHDAEGVKEVYYGCGWNIRRVGSGRINTWHNGLIAGTSALLVRRWDGFAWAVLFNTDSGPNGKQLASQIDPLIHRAVDEVKRWPE